jgi:hypothetical protein
VKWLEVETTAEFVGQFPINIVWAFNEVHYLASYQLEERNYQL